MVRICPRCLAAVGHETISITARRARSTCYTASDSDVKLKSRTRSAGIASPPDVRTGRPIASRLFSMNSGDSSDLPVLDQERAVAGESGVHERALVYGANVPAVGDENTPLRGGDDLVEGLCPALEPQ
jgi:hypothetical protein